MAVDVFKDRTEETVSDKKSSGASKEDLLRVLCMLNQFKAQVIVWFLDSFIFDLLNLKA